MIDVTPLKEILFRDFDMLPEYKNDGTKHVNKMRLSNLVIDIVLS